ncbi:uncharacterized protein [Cherax quadricarinatus]|uniref:uncharacterized protein n=1 Tax=Cherax quadricarinatus TaxID=27406 RepID=UPI00387EAA28
MITSIDPDTNLLFNDLNDSNNYCNYYTAEQSKALLRANNNITIFNYNIRSLSKHYDDLLALLNSLHASMSIITLTQTWLKPDTTDVYAIPGYTAIHNCRPDQQGGGTAIYYSDQLECITNTCTRDEHGEYIIVKFKSKYLQKPLTVINIYRVPQSNISQFSQNLGSMITDARLNKDHLLLSGDFNINLLQDQDPHVTEFTNTMSNCMLLPTVTKPTRVTETSVSLLDHIWTNTISPLKSGIITDNTTDHYPTFLITTLGKIPQDTTKVTFRLHNEAAINNFTTAVTNIDWHTELEIYTDIDECFNNFLKKTQYLYNKHQARWPGG